MLISLGETHEQRTNSNGTNTGKYCTQSRTNISNNAFTYDLRWKGKDNPVTDLDKAAERIIKEYLMGTAPGNFVGEEYGTVENNLERTYYMILSTAQDR